HSRRSSIIRLLKPRLTMTTTPTLWSHQVTFSTDINAFGPKVLALADDSFVLGWENDVDIFGRHVTALGAFSGGDFLSGLSSADNKPLSDSIFVQETGGAVVVLYSEESAPGK